MYLFSCVLYTLLVTSTVYSASVKNEFESALLGPEECLDSSYWCTNITTAINCNAFKHCIQTVWQNTKFVQGSCSDCETEIQSIRDTLDSNFTKAALTDLLLNGCSLTPIPSICDLLVKKYVAQNLDELLDLLKSNIDGSVICRILGLCLSNTNKPVSTTPDDDVYVRYDNIELHFPASYLDMGNMEDLLGASKCTWGPSYWCNNITSARQCSTTSHCIKNVWSQSEFPEDDDSVCQICKDMVKQARDQLESNDTQELIKEVFEGSCKLLVIKVIKQECMVLADDFIPELTEMLASMMNPTAVCSVAGLCNSPRIDKLIASSASGATDVQIDSCANCTVAFNNVEKYLSSTPKLDVRAKLINVCGELSSFSDSCATLIVKYFDDIYSYLQDLQPWSACHLSGMCAQKYHMHSSAEDAVLMKKTQLKLASQSDDLPCDLCKQLVTHFKQILVANTTEDEFLQVLKGICQQTGKFKDECLQLVEDNFKVIYKFLTEELNPPKICAEVNLCPRNNLISDIDLNLIQDRYNPLILSEVEIIPTTAVAIKGSTECRSCKFIINLIQSQLKNKAIEKDIEKTVKEVCFLVPNSDRAECRKFIDKYSQFVINLLVDETDPGVVCSVLELCPDVRLENKFAFCPICQYVTHFIQTAMENPKTEAQIEQAVEKLCIVFPDAEKQQCDEFISQYSALIIDVLAQEVDPTLVCPALKLCPAVSAGRDECKSCTYTINSLIDSLKVRNAAEIYTGLKHLPKSLPKEYTVSAVQIGLEHGSEVVDMIMAEFSAPETCTYLNHCQQYPKEFTGEDVETNEIQTVSVVSPNCELCKMFVKIYEKKLVSVATEKEVEIYLSEFCSDLPKDDQKNCTSLVYKYVPKFFDLLKKDVPPEKLCELAKICPTAEKIDLQEKCRSCEVALGSLQALLADPKIASIGLDNVDKLCSYVPKKNRPICDAVVFQLGRQIEGIVLGIPSWYYCSKIHMCPYALDMILSKECTEGESFWCRGKPTAEACDKVEYCEKKGWHFV